MAMRSKPCGKDAVGSLAARPISGITRCAVVSARYIRYVPLDEIDFERRDWVPESGWPFSRRDIQPFYERAQKVCGIGKFDDRSGAWETGTKKSQPWQTEKIESVVSQFGSSEIFLKRYRRELVRDERVTVILRGALLHFADGSPVPCHHLGAGWHPGWTEVPGQGQSLCTCCRRLGKRPHFAASGLFAARRTRQPARHGRTLFHGSPSDQAGSAHPLLQRGFWTSRVL